MALTNDPNDPNQQGILALGTPFQPLTIEQLYQQVLGRSADPGGMEYWTGMFGQDVDENELGQFRIAAQPEIDSRVAAPAPTPAPFQPLTIEQMYQQVLGRPADQDGLGYWTNLLGPEVDENELAQFRTAAQPEIDSRVAAPLDLAQIGNTPGLLPQVPPTPTNVYDLDDKAYDKDQLLNLAQQIAANINPSQIGGGVFGETQPNVGFSYTQAQNILGKDPSVYDQVVLDMARQLLNQGVTDFSQLRVGEYQPPGVETESGMSTIFVVGPRLYYGD